MGLPIPLGVILERDRQLYYASLHVAVAGEKLPPATEDDLDAIAADESLACGIVMFDSWIVNEDRHVGNISYLDETRSTYLSTMAGLFWIGAAVRISNLRKTILPSGITAWRIGSRRSGPSTIGTRR